MNATVIILPGNGDREEQTERELIAMPRLKKRVVSAVARGSPYTSPPPIFIYKLKIGTLATKSGFVVLSLSDTRVNIAKKSRHVRLRLNCKHYLFIYDVYSFLRVNEK